MAGTHEVEVIELASDRLRVDSNSLDPARVLLAAIALHLGLAILHGVTHTIIPVWIADWQTAVVVVALFLAPVFGAALALSGRVRLAAVVVLLAGLTGFTFEVVFHFLVANPDHVAAVTTHRAAFGATAGISTVADLGLVAAGAWALRR